MKLTDAIMRMFGYENINNIVIYPSWSPPSKEKMKRRRMFYKMHHKFCVPIVVKDIGLKILVDGYTSYLIARENNIKYVKVVRA